MSSERVAGPLAMPPGYGEATPGRLLAWESVDSRLDDARNYWLATASENGKPHVTPVWGVWREPCLYFTGIPTARWARNLSVNPAATAHLEDGSSVVILDGVVVDLPRIEDPSLSAFIADRWTEKYGTLVPDPASDGMYCLQVRQARAWTDFPADATRWTFRSLT